MGVLITISERITVVPHECMKDGETVTDVEKWGWRYIDIPICRIWEDGSVRTDEDFQDDYCVEGMLKNALDAIQKRKAKRKGEEKVKSEQDAVEKAAIAENVEEMKRVVENPKTDYKIEEDGGLFAAREVHDIILDPDSKDTGLSRETWEFLIESGISIDARYNGKTPLLHTVDKCIALFNPREPEPNPEWKEWEKKEHVRLYNEHRGTKDRLLEHLEMLLELGADPDAREIHANGDDVIGWPALFDAMEWGDEEVARMLVKHGASTDLPEPMNVSHGEQRLKSPKIREKWEKFIGGL